MADLRLNKVYKEIDQEAHDNNFYCCHFDGSNWMLGHAHIVRKSHSNKLKYEKRNIILACQDCHFIFDNGTIDEVMELNNIEPVLEKMKKLDILYYNRFVDRK